MITVTINRKSEVVTPTIFPDGSSQVWKLKHFSEIADLRKKYTRPFVNITWNFESEAELIHLNQLCNLLDYSNCNIDLKIPYFPYARQDKGISNTETFARHSFIKLLKQIPWSSITTYDIHSDLDQYMNFSDGRFKNKVLWNRDVPSKAKGKQLGFYNVFGHTPKPDGPLITKHYANIDTGCVFKRVHYGKLTALHYPSLEFIQQENID